MYSALSPGAIGVHVDNLADCLKAAKIGGFQGVEINPNEIEQLITKHSDAQVNALFSESGVRPAAFGLPIDWRGDESPWKEGLRRLPAQAKAAQAIGVSRTMTWVLPGSNERNFDQERRFLITRFQPIAAILKDHGISLGLEFIGPKTLRDGLKFPGIYTLEAMLDLGESIGKNVGLLLDCWHWHTSGGTLQELNSLRPEQIAYVHVNDAPAGVPLEALVDNVRGLPGETGVIDIAGFLQALDRIGYDGPVTPEPFKKELSALPSDEDRLRAVGDAMRTIFAKASLTPK